MTHIRVIDVRVTGDSGLARRALTRRAAAGGAIGTHPARGELN